MLLKLSYSRVTWVDLIGNSNRPPPVVNGISLSRHDDRVLLVCHVETRRWIQPAEAGHPDRGPSPAAACGEEHGLPEVQPSGPVPLHQVHPPGDPLHPAQCPGGHVSVRVCMPRAILVTS